MMTVGRRYAKNNGDILNLTEVASFYGNPFRGTLWNRGICMGARRPPRHRPNVEPLHAPKRDLGFLISVEGGSALLISVLTAVLKMGWELRSFLIFVGIIMIIDLLRRIPQRVAMRMVFGAVGIGALILFSWQSVVEDFNRDPGMMKLFGFLPTLTFSSTPQLPSTLQSPPGAAGGAAIHIMPAARGTSIRGNAFQGFSNPIVDEGTDTDIWHNFLSQSPITQTQFEEFFKSHPECQRSGR